MYGNLIEAFKEKAEEVSSTVFISGNNKDGINYIETILEKEKIRRIAVLDVDESYSRQLLDHGFELIGRPFRDKASEIKASVTSAFCGIAETGTLVIQSDSEDLRLATMLPDIHFSVISAGSIVERATDLTYQLKDWFRNCNYTSFITGPSRTADIERVLTLGAHGPVQLHIIIKL
jgi:L-lactate dehydrogenase complex protein LldG